MIESAFFRRVRESAETIVARITANPVGGLLYMLAVLPLFLLVALSVLLGRLPGLILHGLLWKGRELRNAPESTKLLHDISLVLLTGVSATLAFVYVFPQFAGLVTDDPRCSTMPYC